MGFFTSEFSHHAVSSNTNRSCLPGCSLIALAMLTPVALLLWAVLS